MQILFVQDLPMGMLHKDYNYGSSRSIPLTEAVAFVEANQKAKVYWRVFGSLTGLWTQIGLQEPSKGKIEKITSFDVVFYVSPKNLAIVQKVSIIKKTPKK